MTVESATGAAASSKDVVTLGREHVIAGKYDAFISYSHALDGKVAEAVQVGLHRLARPWRALRAVRTFRDTTTLSANPGLWESIAAALDDSRFFILLAGPEAAASSWVAREVEYWRTRNGFEQVLIVVTDGELVWDADAGRIDTARTNCLPPALADTIATEPRFVDLSWARSQEKLSLRDPRFRDAIAELAAPLHGVTKDELVGEDVRQHTRVQRITKAAVSLLVLLLIAAVIAAVVAITQRNRAQTQAALATSRYLAAQSVAESGAHPSRGLLMAAYGLHLTDTTEARSAILSNLWQRPQLLKVLEDHADRAWAISRIVYSPNGRRLAVAGQDGAVVLWDAAKGRPIGRPLAPHIPGAPVAQSMLSIAYSPNGKRLATGNESGEVTIWDAATGRKVARAEFGAPVGSLAYSSDGAFLAVGFQDQVGDVDVFRLASGNRVREFKLGHEIFSVAFSRHGDELAMGNGWGDILLDNVANPRAAPQHLSSGDTAEQLEFSHDDKVLACACGDAGIRLWHLQRRITAPETFGRGPFAYAVSFSRDDKTLASSFGDGYVRLWDLATLHQTLAPLLASWKDEVLTVAFSPVTDTLVSGSGDGQLLLWSARQRWPFGTSSIFERPAGSSLSWLPAPILGPPLGPDAAIAAISPDGHLLAVTTSRGAALWNAQTGREIGRLPSLPGHATTAAFDASGTSILVGYDTGAVAVYDTNTRRLVQQGRPTRRAQALRSVAFAADGAALVASDDATPGHVYLWDARTGASIGRTIKADSEIDDLAADPLLNIAATGNFESTVELWDTRTGKPHGTVPGHSNSLVSVAFSRDGNFLASASDDGSVIVTNVKTRQTVANLPINGVSTVALDGTGRTLAAAANTTVQLWDVATAREIGPPFPLGAGVSALAFTEQGDLVTILGTNPITITRWRFDPRAWIRTACAIANRGLTTEELSQFVGAGFSGEAPCASR